MDPWDIYIYIWNIGFVILYDIYVNVSENVTYVYTTYVTFIWYIWYLI